jgi:hypothetical protein
MKKRRKPIKKSKMAQLVCEAYNQAINNNKQNGRNIPLNTK